jgi:hypothetical protein
MGRKRGKLTVQSCLDRYKTGIRHVRQLFLDASASHQIEIISAVFPIIPFMKMWFHQALGMAIVLTSAMFLVEGKRKKDEPARL